MTPPARGPSVLAVEGRPAGRLENMSSRPSTVVTHAADGTRCQLVPSLRVRLDPARVRVASGHGPLLRTLGLPRSVERAEPAEQRRMAERVCRAVIEDLHLPGVIALAPGGGLPDETACEEPLLALTVLTRCSGPVWLRDRPAALERLTEDRPVGLLLQPGHFRFVRERLAGPAWATRILARVRGAEG